MIKIKYKWVQTFGFSLWSVISSVLKLVAPKTPGFGYETT